MTPNGRGLRDFHRGVPRHECATATSQCGPGVYYRGGGSLIFCLARFAGYLIVPYLYGALADNLLESFSEHAPASVRDTAYGILERYCRRLNSSR
jgi:hypothetical protein